MAEPQNIIELLIHDHRGMAVLAEQMDSEGTPEQIHEAFVEFTTEYAAHESAEHEVVYPALLDAVPAADRNALTCLGHHRELNDLLAGMRGLDLPSVGFEQRASALLLEVRAHFAEEENIFPLLETALDQTALVELAERAVACKRRSEATWSCSSRAMPSKAVPKFTSPIP